MRRRKKRSKRGLDEVRESAGQDEGEGPGADQSEASELGLQDNHNDDSSGDYSGGRRKKDYSDPLDD